MTGSMPNRLATYVPTLRECDEILRLRLILHDFGLVWVSTAQGARLALVEDEPAPIDPQWDAFLAAYVEYLCQLDGIDPPAWVTAPVRFLRQCWYPGGCLPHDRVRTIVTTPVAFEMHGIWFPKEELKVV